MIENYIKEADRVTYLMPKEVDHHCAGQIIAELDALIEGCGCLLYTSPSPRDA